MSLYKHYKNGKLYKIQGYGRIQENGIWVDALIYTEKGKTEKYIHRQDEFDEKFEQFFKINLPKNIVKEIREDLSRANELNKFLNSDTSDLFGYHMSLGMNIRNRLNLWDPKKLKKIFKKWDLLPHADDASFEIIKEVQRILREENKL